MQTSCSQKTYPDVPTESDSRLRPTKPSSGSAHNSQFPPLHISLPPNPARLTAARSSTRSSLLCFSPHSRHPSSPRQHPQAPSSSRRFRCPLPGPLVPFHNSQSSADRKLCLPVERHVGASLPVLRFPRAPRFCFSHLRVPTVLPSPHPTPAATAASHKKSFHPQETAK